MFVLFAYIIESGHSRLWLSQLSVELIGLWNVSIDEAIVSGSSDLIRGRFN